MSAWNDDAPDYPDVPGFKGTADTGRDAAADLAPRVGRLQRVALEAIRAAGCEGLTADELAARLALTRWTIQPRTSELRLKGLIADSGKRRHNQTGKRAIVWTLPEFASQADRAA